jgi:acyl-CoA synthetase (AMP-forming)/AMP-acid ligase II
VQPIAPEIANVGELVSRAARIHAKRLAVTSAQRAVTYAELEQRSNRLANALLGLGLKRGDRVGIYLPNRPEIVEVELACYKAGLIKAPFNARLSPNEVGEIAANSDAASSSPPLRASILSVSTSAAPCRTFCWWTSKPPAAKAARTKQPWLAQAMLHAGCSACR